MIQSRLPNASAANGADGGEPEEIDPLSLGDDIEAVVPTTDSARRVVDLVRRYGKGYIPGELSSARGQAITGSEIPTVFGENRFETKNALFFKKAFGVQIPDNPNMAHGRKYEPVAIARFKKQYQCKVFFVNFMRSDRWDFIAGTFDFLAILANGEGVLCEVKCPPKRSIGDYVPPQYVGQVQAYIEIADLPSGLFIQYKPSFLTEKRKIRRPEKLVVTRVQRDRSYFESRILTLWNFWVRLCAFREAVLPTAAPAADFIKSFWRDHRKPSVRGCIKVRLCAASFRYERTSRTGVFQQVVERMAATMPNLPTITMPIVVVTDMPSQQLKTRLVVVPMGEDDSNSARVCEAQEACKEVQVPIVIDTTCLFPSSSSSSSSSFYHHQDQEVVPEDIQLAVCTDDTAPLAESKKRPFSPTPTSFKPNKSPRVD